VALSTTTNEAGLYRFLFLNPGKYKLVATIVGFKTFERGNIQLTVSESATLPVTLEVGAQSDRTLQYTISTYYGERPLHDVLDRTAWHAAQHTRQLMLMLESSGMAPDRPLTGDDLRGLPVPDEVWG